MKSRSVIFVNIIIVTICLSGCYNADISIDLEQETDEITLDNYEISSITYIEEDDENNINIEYPVVFGLSDEGKQKKINELIKVEALKGYTAYYSEDRDFLGRLDLDIHYNVSLESDYILSIQYYGLGELEMAPHPNKLFYTTNIDMMMGNKLRLVNIVNIKEGFINKFIDGEFEHIGPLDIEPDLGEYEIYDVVEDRFVNADNMGSTFSYLTKDSLGISIPAGHAIGGYAEYEIKYKDIWEYLWDDIKGWNEFISSIEE